MQTFGFHDGAEILANNLVNMRHLARLLPLAQQKKVFNDLEGQHRSHLRGRGMDYAEVRQYQAGDDLRSMDWRVTARTGKPHIKVFQQEKERPIFIVCDLRAPMFFGSRRALKSVLAADLSALLAWASLIQGDRVGALLFNEHQEINLRPKPGHKAVLLLLNKLTELAQSSRTDATEDTTANARMQQMCRHLRRIAPPGARIYFISDWLGFDEQSQQQLFNVSQHSDIIALHLSDPLEQELPPPGLYPMTNGRETVHLDTSNPESRHRYTQNFQQSVDILRQRLLALKIPLITLSTQDSHPLETLRAGLGLSHVGHRGHHA